jgi:hypothetical protein
MIHRFSLVHGVVLYLQPHLVVSSGRPNLDLFQEGERLEVSLQAFHLGRLIPHQPNLEASMTEVGSSHTQWWDIPAARARYFRGTVASISTSPPPSLVDVHNLTI